MFFFGQKTLPLSEVKSKCKSRT